MIRHPWKRLVAWLIDWVLVLAWACITAAVGVPLYLSGATAGLGPIALNVISVVVLVAPVTVALAALESGRRQATIGKRMQRLVVTDAATGSRLSFPRALGRNVLKIALPWAVGHAAVFGMVATAAADAAPPWIWVLTALAYVVPVVYVVTLFMGAGATPYDRAARSHVAIGDAAGGHRDGPASRRLAETARLPARGRAVE